MAWLDYGSMAQISAQWLRCSILEICLGISAQWLDGLTRFPLMKFFFFADISNMNQQSRADVRDGEAWVDQSQVKSWAHILD